MAENLEHLLDFLVAAVHGRDLVLASQQVQVRGEGVQRLGQLQALAEALFAQLVIAHLRRDARDERRRRNALTADDRHRHAVALLQDRGEEIRRCDCSPIAGRPMERELEHGLRIRRYAEFASRQRRQQLEVLVERVEDHVRVDLEILHHVRERVPFDLRQSEEEVLVRDDRVFAAPALFHGPVHHALS